VYKERVHDDSADRFAVDGCLRGDQEAFASLVTRYQEGAFRAAYLIVRDEHAARDVAQEGFVRAYRNLHRYNPEGPFRPWLLRIVTNLALNEIRSRNRRRNLFDRVRSLASHPPPSPERALEESDGRQRLWDAINTLPGRDRTILYLRHYLELPEAEIAAVIGKRPGTVKSRLSRAGARLRTVIERDYPDLIPHRSNSGGANGRP
jgi:RNA polymerase sigma-70 factor (ECF subfamily)